jgi:hypothetical protein
VPDHQQLLRQLLLPLRLGEHARAAPLAGSAAHLAAPVLRGRCGNVPALLALLRWRAGGRQERPGVVERHPGPSDTIGAPPIPTPANDFAPPQMFCAWLTDAIWPESGVLCRRLRDHPAAHAPHCAQTCQNNICCSGPICGGTCCSAGQRCECACHAQYQTISCGRNPSQGVASALQSGTCQREPLLRRLQLPHCTLCTLHLPLSCGPPEGVAALHSHKPGHLPCLMQVAAAAGAGSAFSAAAGPRPAATQACFADTVHMCVRTRLGQPLARAVGPSVG